MWRFSFAPSLKETNSNSNHTDNDVTSCPDQATPEVQTETEQSKGKWCVGSKGVFRLIEYIQ